ncbi:hypothetical protein BDQ12DRAFT_616883 [Crucibulum laeve]|uniref:CxC6 like cysteine cluster associated with KDZ domain-containing protein n=1 Tax=Crucibulum laeve TaxID=68775 RepID=A0A5C3LHF1_9AGAR|nr:hypothetical protein BDQ12DRAFT_616883 [Crucibulum laeve]
MVGGGKVLQSANNHACSECTQEYKSTSDIIAQDSPAAPMDLDHFLVNMVIVDGIFMGPQHCAYDGCTADLANGCGGVFCASHESAYGESCRVHHCQNIKE